MHSTLKFSKRYTYTDTHTHIHTYLQPWPAVLCILCWGLPVVLSLHWWPSWLSPSGATGRREVRNRCWLAEIQWQSSLKHYIRMYICTYISIRMLDIHTHVLIWHTFTKTSSCLLLPSPRYHHHNTSFRFCCINMYALAIVQVTAGKIHCIQF